MATYNPLADGDLVIDHAASKKGSPDRVYFRITAQGKQRRDFIEDFFATSGYRHAPVAGMFRRTKAGYSVAR